MKFVVKPTGIADWVAILISSPQCGRGCSTVGTTGSRSPGSRLKKDKFKGYETKILTNQRQLEMFQNKLP